MFPNMATDTLQTYENVLVRHKVCVFFVLTNKDREKNLERLTYSYLNETICKIYVADIFIFRNAGFSKGHLRSPPSWKFRK